MPDLSSVTIAVPTRDQARNIAMFLGSLPAQLSLIVVDKSDDNTPNVVQQASSHNTKLLHCGGTLTEARQVGAEAGRYRVCALYGC